MFSKVFGTRSQREVKRITVSYTHLITGHRGNSMVTLKWSLVFDKMTSLLQGCAVTMEISVLTLIFGTILGVVLALMRDSHIKVVSRLAQMYIWIWRGTPLMVQAFLILSLIHI